MKQFFKSVAATVVGIFAFGIIMGIFTFIGTDDLDVENIAMDMGIDNHLQFSEDEAGTKAMLARENRARERYNKCRAMDCKMEAGSYFEEK